MTSKDTKFMKEIGIEPCDLDKPFQPLLPLPERESLIPHLAESDVAFLLKYGVVWGSDPEKGFVPPHNLREYLSRYPSGIKNGVEDVAREMKRGLSGDDLDDLARQITLMFLDFALSAEDLVEAYPQSPPPEPGQDRSMLFHAYINLCVRAAMMTLFKE
jgi:hypothetical protein